MLGVWTGEDADVDVDGSRFDGGDLQTMALGRAFFEGSGVVG